MINYKELRVGNYVTLLKNGVHPAKVTEIREDSLIVDLEYDGLYHGDHRRFYAIPLTEEVLRAAGFELQKDRDMYWISLNNYSIILHIEKGGRFSYFINSIQIMYVDTLHQLQNLVHALTGSELEVSLPLIGNSPIRDNK